MAVAAVDVTGTLRRHRALVAIVVVGFVLRVTWVWMTDVIPPTAAMASGDQFSYWYLATELSHGRGYHRWDTPGPSAYYPVGYPALLAAAFWLVRVTSLPIDQLAVAHILNVVASTASIALVYVVGRQLFGHRAGLVAAAVLAMFPNMVFQVTSLQLETMYIAWCLAALAVVVTHDWSTGAPSTRRLVLFGVLLGISVQIRPFSVWFLVAVLIAALVAGLGWRRSLAAAAVPALVVALIAVPWTIRNAIQMDALLLTSTNTGDTLCLDRNLDAQGGFRWADHDGCADPTLPEVERNRQNIDKAIGFVVDHPARELLQIVRRGRLIFGSDHDGIIAVNTLGGGPVLSERTSDVLIDVADGYYVAVLVLSAAGLAVGVGRAAFRRRPATWLVLVSLASLITVPLLLWGNPRFHLPFSPLLAVFAGGAVAAVVERRPSRSLSA